MLEKPQIVQTSETRAAILPLAVPREEIQKVMGLGLQEVMAAVSAQGIAPAGPWFTHHYRMDPKVFDFEIGVPVSKPFTAAGRVKPGALPATRVARTVYRGPYEGLGEAWGEFGAWIEAEGLKAAPDLWEVYLVGPESGSEPDAFRTELTRPLQA